MTVSLTSARLRKLILVLVIREKSKLPWERSKIATIARLCTLLRELRQTENSKRIWVTEAYTVEERMRHGASGNYIETVRRTDEKKFFSFLRMSPAVFDLLLSIVGPSITKQRAVREPISAKCRLEITLRYLATGDNYETLAALFRVSAPSVSLIVDEVTAALWTCLKPLVFQDPTEEFWLQKAAEFDLEWDFVHCIGGIDSKLIQVQAPPHSGSLLHDYKGHHSFHLHAIADAYQMFSIVDVGAAGRQSDGGVLRASRMGQLFMNDEMNVPPPAPIVEGGPALPYCLVGDEAFALSNFMMRPYPRCRPLNMRQRVFDYRLSRARRIVECAFGTLSQTWRVMRPTMVTSLKVAIQVCHACTCLHNFLIMHEERRFRRQRQPEERIQRNNFQYVPEEELEPRLGSMERVRYDFSRYFLEEGAIDCQWEKAQNGHF